MKHQYLVFSYASHFLKFDNVIQEIGTKMFQGKKAYSKDKRQIVNFPNTHFVASNMGGRVQYHVQYSGK